MDRVTSGTEHPRDRKVVLELLGFAKAGKGEAGVSLSRSGWSGGQLKVPQPGKGGVA